MKEYKYDVPYFCVEDWDKSALRISEWKRVRAEDVRAVLSHCHDNFVDSVKNGLVLMYCEREHRTSAGDGCFEAFETKEQAVMHHVEQLREYVDDRRREFEEDVEQTGRRIKETLNLLQSETFGIET